MNTDTENVSALTNKNNHSSSLIEIGLQTREVRDDWRREFGVQTDTKSTNVPRAASNQYDECGHIPRLPNPEQRQSCSDHTAMSVSIVCSTNSTVRRAAASVCPGHILQQSEPALVTGTIPQVSSKRWPLPCPSDYVSGSESFSHMWHKIRKKLPPYLLPTSSPGWDKILKAEGMIAWLFVSGAKQFLLPCWIHALGYLVLP